TGPTLTISQAIPAEDNETVPDQDGDYPAYLVLQNSGPAAVDLSGYSLTDNPQTPRKWVFPANVLLPPGSTLVAFASGTDRRTLPYEANFLRAWGSTANLL